MTIYFSDILERFPKKWLVEEQEAIIFWPIVIFAWYFQFFMTK